MALTREEVLIAIRGTADELEDAMRDARRAIDRVPNTTTKEFDVATKQAEAKLKAMSNLIRRVEEDAELRHELDVDTGTARANVESFRAELAAIPRETTVDVDVKRGIIETLAGIGRGADRVAESFSGTQSAGSAAAAMFFRLFFLLKGLAPLIGGIGILLGVSLVPAILAVVSSLGAAVAGAGALATAFAAALGPVVVGLVALFQRFTAIMEARQKAEQAKTAAAKESADADRTAAAAAADRVRREEAIRDALQGVVTAERAYKQAVQDARDAIVQANQDAADAAEDLTEAHENLETVTVEAYRAMADAAEDARDAVLSVQEAELGLERAQLATRKARLELRQFGKDAGIAMGELMDKIVDVDIDSANLSKLLRKAGAEAGLGGEEQLEFEDLALRVREAVLGEKDATDKLGDSKTDLARKREDEAKFAREGIAAYAPYKAAVDQVAQAERTLGEATRRATELRRQGVRGAPAVIAALEGLRDARERLNTAEREAKAPPALSAAASAAEDAKRAYDELTKAEQRFFDGISRTANYLRSFFQPLTDAIFDRLALGMQALPALLDPLRPAFARLGDAMANAMTAVMLVFADPAMRDNLKRIVGEAANLVEVLGQGVFANLLRIFLNIATTALPLLVPLLQEFAGWLDKIADSDVGDMGSTIGTLVESFRVWMKLIGAAAEALLAIFTVAGPHANELIEWITDGIKGFTKWLKTAKGQKKVKQFFEDTLPAVKSFIKFVVALGKVFLEFIQFIGPMAQGFFDALTPVVELLADIFGWLNKIPGVLRYLTGFITGLVAGGKGINLFIRLLGKLPALFGRVLGILGRFGAKVGKILGGAFKAAGQRVWTWITWIVDKVRSLPGAIGRLLGRVVAFIGRQVARIPAIVREPLLKVWNFLKRIATSFFNAARNVAKKIWDGISWILGKLKGLLQPVINAATKIKDGIVGAFTGIGRLVGTALSGIATVIKDVINGVIRICNKAIGLINDATPGKIEIPYAPDIPGLPDIPPIPELARGGILRRDTLFRGGERGREAVLPLTGRVMAQLAKQITRAMQFQAPAMVRGVGGPQAAGAMAGAPGIHIEKIELPPPPEGGVPDARYQAAQLAAELRRRGGR